MLETQDQTTPILPRDITNCACPYKRRSKIVPPDGAKMSHLLNITGLFCIIITLLWVNLSRLFPGLHNYAS